LLFGLAVLLDGDFAVCLPGCRSPPGWADRRKNRPGSAGSAATWGCISGYAPIRDAVRRAGGVGKQHLRP